MQLAVSLLLTVKLCFNEMEVKFFKAPLVCSLAVLNKTVVSDITPGTFYCLFCMFLSSFYVLRSCFIQLIVMERCCFLLAFF